MKGVAGIPRIMGIVNVTPDSFYDGGVCNDAPDAVRHALRLLDEGADIIDIGGESTRPPGRDYGSGHTPLTAQEEISRVVPVIEEVVAQRSTALISIDTMKPDVARAALDAGARIINDVSAGDYDRDIWRVAAVSGVDYIIMHGHDPANIQPVDRITYDDVVATVHRFLEERIDQARQAGVERIIADPGIGFAKGAGDNVRLIQHLADFKDLGVALLAGASRKSFIGRLLGGIPPEERLAGSLAAHAVAWMHGATIIRTHDVAATRQFFSLFQTLTGDAAST